MNGRCSGITREGTRCGRSAEGPNGMCWLHDPSRAADRKRVASRAGRSKPNRELQDVKARLSELADKVLSGAVDRSDAAVASQVLNVYLRAMSIELKVKELEDLERRFEELERLVEAKNARSRYGT